MTLKITRPAGRWYGGKFRLAPEIIRHFPEHRVYVEPFGGMASVLLRKPRSYGEVYNDLDGEAVNLFRVLQDPPQSERLIALLRVTPFARAEFEIGWDAIEEPVERARRLLIRSFMGFGSNAHSSPKRGHRATGFRGNSNRSGTTSAHDWANYPDALAGIVERLRGVVLERRDALVVIGSHDGPETLFYVDPPYLAELRSPGNKYDQKYRMYAHEQTTEDHVRLLATLKAVTGMVVLSGYASPLYDEALPDWERVEIAAFADGARKRTEVLWINPAATKALHHGRRSPLLFAGAMA